jgi:hypothetical protein
MFLQLQILPGAISELYAQATASGYLTLADRYGLMAAVLEMESLNEEEHRAIDRMLRAVRQGKLTVVDRLSITR